MRYLLCFYLFAVLPFNTVLCLEREKIKGIPVRRDSVADTVGTRLKDSVFNETPVSINPERLSLFPAISLQQYLKGNAAGLYVQESSGEPGSLQNMFIRGVPSPLFSPRDVYDAQPLVVLDGIPMVTEHPFAYDIQQYNNNRIGPATNIYTNIDMDNIASVTVLKDIGETALYGPRAVNGVILIKTKKALTMRRVNFNTYIGLAQRPSITTINGEYENDFRQRFYDLYTVNGRYTSDEAYPQYLSDSLSSSYYGPSNWSDLYYRNASVYSVNASITGGTDKANFRFSLGNAQSQGVADATGITRYSTLFNINMKPTPWLLFSATVNANRVERDRNRSLRDRFTEMNYFPDLSAPLSPNKEVYGAYLNNYKNGYDDNKTNIVEGNFNIGINLGKFVFNSRLDVDYNEGYRDLFYPKPLMQSTSYISNYYGFSQRFMFINTADYDFSLNRDHVFHVEAGQSIQWDTYKYNYAYAYKGINDYIKLNLLESDINNSNYLNPLAFPKELLFRFLDRTRNNLMSFYGKADYSYKDKYYLTAIVRTDGSSNAQPTDQWFLSPSLSFRWDLKKELLENNSMISALAFKAGVGRLGRVYSYDNYGEGPQYQSFVGYTGNVTVPGYNAFGVLTRPYSFGWVGYGVPWEYSQQVNAGLSASLLKDRLQVSVDWYNKTEKNLLLGIPSYAEYGYKQSIESGMSVANTGFEVLLGGDILKPAKKVAWHSSLNFNFNRNKLKSLPGGRQQIITNDRLLKVGESFDSYWIYQNDGIYTSDAEVPVVNGRKLNFNGIDFKAGDPKWRDINNDNVINNNDRVLTGHSLPVIAGGFDNTFSSGKWNLGINFYYNLGRKVINQEMASRFDFINREGNSNISSVKEITFWEKRGDYDRYPLYNPWSDVVPYRPEQDLFLENASFLKLRTVSLGYDMTSLVGHGPKFSRFYVYGTVNNIFTITKYSGRDPELIDYTGYDSGYGLPVPTTYSIGVKMQL